MSFKRSLMFGFVTKTWNPLIMYCEHDCKYCYATVMLLRLRVMSGKYECLAYDPDLVKLHEKDLHSALDFGKDDFVFACSMCDLFGNSVPTEYILAILNEISLSYAKFLLLTKNPKRMAEFVADIPKNCMVGITAETNRSTARWSNAPEPEKRFEAFTAFLGKPFERFVCVEPIMDFDLYPFAGLIHQVQPKLVAVGYDNHNCRLPEPCLSKTQELIDLLRMNGIEVYCKTLRERWCS